MILFLKIEGSHHGIEGFDIGKVTFDVCQDPTAMRAQLSVYVIFLPLFPDSPKFGSCAGREEPRSDGQA